MPVPNVVVRDVVCGANHTVSNQNVFVLGNLSFKCSFQCLDKFLVQLEFSLNKSALCVFEIL